jgi:catechol 2,3-dioxygenase-like lactoylglutathione lyase family enzyme
VKTFIAAIWLASNLAAGAAFAQAFPPNEAGVTMGHLHLNSRDVEANKKIFVDMGGVALKIDGAPIQYVKFPGVMVLLNLPPGPPPSTGPSEGTVINHVGFWVQNVQEAVAHWRAAGVPVEPGHNGRTDQAYVVTTDGLRVEILENKDQKVPIQSHHIHFYVPQTAISDIQAWYVKNFGARPSMRGQNQAADIPGANRRFPRATRRRCPRKGVSSTTLASMLPTWKQWRKNWRARGSTSISPS